MSDVSSPSRGSGIARAALLVATVTVAARAVGFVRVLVFARTVGPSCLGDTYFTANTIPNILFDVVAGGALSSIAVPLLAGAVDRGDERTADRTASALLTWTVLLLVPVTVIGLALSRPLMALLVGNGHPGCSAGLERHVGARMLLVFMPQVLLYGIGIVLAGVLQAHRRFLAPALAPLLSSVVVIGAYLTFAATASRRETGLITLTRTHELVLSVGTTLGVVALTLPMWLPVRRTGRRLRMTLRFPPGIGPMARRMAVAGGVALGAQDLATAAILRLANDRGSDGAVVLYNLAWTIFLVPWAVLAVPLATAAFPTLSARWEAGERASYADLAARTSRAIVLVTAAAAAVLVATSVPAARVLVLGAPGGVAPHVLTRALIAFAPGLVGYGLVAHLTRAHYAQGQARAAAIASASGWALTVAADVLLVIVLPRDWTAAALGAGTVIGMSFAACWLALSLRTGADAVLRGAGSTIAASLVAASVAGGVVGVVGAVLPTTGALASAGVAVGLGVACVAGFLAIAAALDRATVRLVLTRRVVDA